MPDVDLPPPIALHRLLAAAPADDIAWYAPDGDRTFGEATRRVDGLARAIAATTAPEGVVAILGENSGRYIECLYGIPAAGRRALLLNYRHHPAEWLAMLDRTRCSLVIGDAPLLHRLAAAHATPTHSPSQPLRMVAFGPDDDTNNDAGPSAARVAQDYESFIVTDARALDDDMQSEVRPDQCAWLVPTSGTTGTPKLAMLSHRSIHLAAFGCHLMRPVRDDDIYLFPFPLCHVAAYNVIVYHQHARPIVVMTRFEPAAVVDAIERHRVTAASLAPTMIATMLDTPGLLDGRDLASLHTVGYGSSGITPSLLQRAMQTLGCGFSQGYGMTELSGNAVFLGTDEHAVGASGDAEMLARAGMPTPLAALRIVDDERREVAAGSAGEIAVRGPQVMLGYFDDDAATNAAIVDGWLHTGDIGVIDADGYLRVVDRKKDIIISGGENVASREVEAVLASHDAVREVAVIGVPDERWGEIVTAVVALHADSAVTPDELVTLCRSRLAGFKVPRRVEFVDDLPKNTTGKIEKHRLREMLAPQ